MSLQNEFRVKIKSEHYDVDASLFSDDTDEPIELDEYELDSLAEGELWEVSAICNFEEDENSVSISYEETEASGMEGSRTTVAFSKENPDTVTMVRKGSVSATLVFEAGKRNHTIYKTPYMPFDVAVLTKKVVNLLLTDGTLELDYIVEIRGATAERTKFHMQLLK